MNDSKLVTPRRIFLQRAAGLAGATSRANLIAYLQTLK